MKRLLHFSTTIFLTVLLSYSFAETKLPGDNWVLAATAGDVTMYYQVVNCSGDDVVLLKFVNSGADALSVKWKERILSENEIRQTVPNPAIDDFKHLELTPGQTLEASCTTQPDPELIAKASALFPTDANPHILEYHVETLIVE